RQVSPPGKIDQDRGRRARGPAVFSPFFVRVISALSPVSGPRKGHEKEVCKMAINRWSPVGELASLHTAMDRLFGDFFSGSALDTDQNGAQSTTWYLPLDIVDAGSAYQVKAAVPGFKPEDVEVTFHDGLLNIVARHREEST